MKSPRILFVSHSYPPIVGGVETLNHSLVTWLSKYAEVTLLANRRRRLLPWFMLYAPLRVLLVAWRYDVVVLGSGILGHVGFLVKLFTRTPVASGVYGLDLTWSNGLYQALWVRRFLPRLDRLIAIGNETIRAGVARGIPAGRFVFIPGGVDDMAKGVAYTRADLEEVLEENLAGRKVLLGLGRLVRRKGVAWFIEHVLPGLPQDVLYIVAGDGPERLAALAAARRAQVVERVRLLGYVDDRVRSVLLATSDVFVQPNIAVQGDMEGFGLVVIEAAINALPVLASRLEGLQDAISEGQNGYLLPSGDAAAFVARISALLGDEAARKAFGQRARAYTLAHYHWEKIVLDYLAALPLRQS